MSGPKQSRRRRHLKEEFRVWVIAIVIVGIFLLITDGWH
jgi:hypothetical protein